MSTAADILTKYLKALMSANDPIFKSVIADKDGTPEVIILKPMDYGKGAVANVLEWLRNMAGGDGSMIDQLFIDKADTKWLDYTVQVYMGIDRFESETDAELVARIRKYVTSPKMSPASLILALREFSTAEPVILESEKDTAFSDVTFSDQYKLFKVIGGLEDGNWVQPAIAGPALGGGPFFVVIITDAAPEDYNKVIDVVERWRPVGVAYEVQVVT